MVLVLEPGLKRVSEDRTHPFSLILGYECEIAVVSNDECPTGSSRSGSGGAWTHLWAGVHDVRSSQKRKGDGFREIAG